MRALVISQDELIIRTLERVLTTSYDVEFLVESRPLARRLGDAGLHISFGDPRRVDTYLKADLAPTTPVIVEDRGRRGVRRIVEAVRDAGGTMVYVLRVGGRRPSRADELGDRFPDVTQVDLAELVGPALETELSRSLTRARVQQYQRYFADADRILILLHNDPDPDALASGLALRALLRRTKTTAIIGAMQGVTRPENLRMANLLDIQVEPITAESLATFERIATVDVQPHYFSEFLNRVDLVVDHHPEQSGYSAIFKDIRPDYGSTCTILTEHLRAIDWNISHTLVSETKYSLRSPFLCTRWIRPQSRSWRRFMLVFPREIWSCCMMSSVQSGSAEM